MDLFIRNIPYEANEWTVTRAVALVLHSEDFAPVVPGRLINFRVKLNESRAGGRHDGTGYLTVPTRPIGVKFLQYISKEPIKVLSKKIKFTKKDNLPPEHIVQTLKKTPYVDPNIEEERLGKVWALEKSFRLRTVQFGFFYEADNIPGKNARRSSRAFSIEWEHEYVESFASLRFDYDDKLICITLGDGLKGQEPEGYNVIINFSSIQKVGIGYDGNPYVCFDTLTPPVMEKTLFHRPSTGNSSVDNNKYRQRVGALHEGHAVVAPYAPHIRIVLCDNLEMDVIQEFANVYEIAGHSKSMLIKFDGPLQIEASKRQFFTTKRIFQIRKVLAGFDWPIAFQLECLLHNGLLHTAEIDRLVPRVRSMLEKQNKSQSYVGSLLCRYGEILRDRPYGTSPSDCFEETLKDFKFFKPLEGYRCYHVTFTPTRMILEGPYASQSNRVIRQYQGFEDHFIRVDFRDEDRLQYRWDRKVDGTSFLVERVGSILKRGFELAGRNFEFLAYSSSALREHAVWFVNPFNHPDKGTITGASIRQSLGNFAGSELLKQPSKFAARLAQAFTATETSVDIRRSEWEEIDDLGVHPYLFTDGVGTISKALGDRICLIQKYQIRFLGYKGVVAIDEQLDIHPSGVQMRLRPSMKKFEVQDNAIAPLEIAQAFERPNACYLNRALIMALEDLGVRKTAFEDLQDRAIADVKTIDDSIENFSNVLEAHRMGLTYRLREILLQLKSKYKMDLKTNRESISLDNPFFRQIRQVAISSILRDIKHRARIPVPCSYHLVGIADEGPHYEEKEGYSNVFTLKEREIFVCVQDRTGEPIWIEGDVSISRSPVACLGDVQRVRAIGKPPEDRLCLFSHLRNVVVMPSKGPRSLASCLGGGDVDGDSFSVICHDTILPRTIEDPASYKPVDPLTLDRDTTVDDICDFIVEYINSDILGLLSDRLLIIADQSSEGLRDKDCVKLAELCSQAVDYPKQGVPPNVDTDQLPRTLIRCKPDWHAAEVVSPRTTDYYESNRALGFLFRSVELGAPKPLEMQQAPLKNFSDPISIALLEEIRGHLGDSAFETGYTPPEVSKIFKHYTDELKYITATHTLSNSPGNRLLEAEVVVGTILAKCSQKRWRQDRIYRMGQHSMNLVKEVQRTLFSNMDHASYEDISLGLELSWCAWGLSQRHRHEFGANSFGLVALGTLLDCLEKL